MTRDEIIQLVDFSRLKRNYIENPIRKHTKPLDCPFKEDLEYLYLELNLDLTEIGEFLGFSTVGSFIKFFNIIKSKNLIHECRARRNIEKYGVRNPSQLKEIRNKIKKNNLEKYGVESVNSLEWKKEKTKNTCLEKYGVDNYSKTREFIEKSKSTKLEKYGDENFTNREKCKNTCLKKYGVVRVSQLSQFKERFKNIEFKNSFIKKQRETKHKNKSFSGSKIENKLFNLLLEKFPDSMHHYSNDSRYTYECDFYIPSLDIFIEYQGFWTHGFHPFDKNNPEDLKKVDDLKKKSKEKNYKSSYKNFYKNAINIWTDLDVRKRETAKRNNLNYLEFFTVKEFMEWYNKQ